MESWRRLGWRLVLLSYSLSFGGTRSLINHFFSAPQIGSALIHLLRSGVLGTPEKIDPNAPTDGGWGVGIWAGNRPGELAHSTSSFLVSRERKRPLILVSLVGTWAIVEWQITDMACGAFSLVSVALYDTLGPVSRFEREEERGDERTNEQG